MICPCCDHDKIAILENRGGRRRRECKRCFHRWTTYEVSAQRLERLERLEEAVAKALDLELETPPPRASDQGQRLPSVSAEVIGRLNAERRAREKQQADQKRRQRLQKAYDEERKARGW